MTTTRAYRPAEDRLVDAAAAGCALYLNADDVARLAADDAIERAALQPRARGRTRKLVNAKVPRGELLVWRANYYRDRHLAGGPFPDSWTRV